MATIYSFQFRITPLLSAISETSGFLRISSSDLKKYYPSYYFHAIDNRDFDDFYLVSFCNCSIYPGRFRTYYAVLPFRSIAPYVTPSGVLSPCLSESQLRRLALIVRCCHYRYSRLNGKSSVYRRAFCINLERPL